MKISILVNTIGHIVICVLNSKINSIIIKNYFNSSTFFNIQCYQQNYQENIMLLIHSHLFELMINIFLYFTPLNIYNGNYLYKL